MVHSPLFWSLLLGVQNDEEAGYPNTWAFSQACEDTMQPKPKTVFPLEAKYDCSEAKYDCSFPSIRPTFDVY